jgi:putative colanic acid biosynthesis UDP-glucose lipid carrier transferase
MSEAATVQSHADASNWSAAASASGGERPPRKNAVSPGAAMPVATSRRKRAFDIMVAAVALLFFLPLLLTVAVLIRLESKGPALFRQRRTGLNGVIFTVFKFRTMTVVEDGAAIQQATQGDRRITPLGAVLRKFSIDELPQLLNVLRGDMSLIGPRPHAVAHDELWGAQAPGYDRRFRARPGLTGYAAVCGFRGEVKDLQAIIDRVGADNEYIDTWTFGLDMKIICRTVPLVFSDSNAY